MSEVSETLWIANNGRLSCVEHGGAYLSAAVQAHPRSMTHTTPLDHWIRVTDAVRAEWAKESEVPLTCETCNALMSQGKRGSR